MNEMIACQVTEKKTGVTVVQMTWTETEATIMVTVSMTIMIPPRRLQSDVEQHFWKDARPMRKGTMLSNERTRSVPEEENLITRELSTVLTKQMTTTEAGMGITVRHRTKVLLEKINTLLVL